MHSTYMAVRPTYIFVRSLIYTGVAGTSDSKRGGFKVLGLSLTTLFTDIIIYTRAIG